MYPATSRRLTAGLAALVLAGGLASCGQTPTVDTTASATTAEDSANHTPAPSSDAPQDDSTALTQSAAPSSGPAEDASTAPGGQSTMDDAFAAAVQAMVDDDRDAFLAHGTQDVYDRLHQQQEGVDGLTWTDWDVMGGRSSEQEARPRIPGTCVPEVRTVHQDQQPLGDPDATCELSVEQDDGSQMLMGTFYLHQGEDSTWTVVDYVRGYQ